MQTVIYPMDNPPELVRDWREIMRLSGIIFQEQYIEPEDHPAYWEIKTQKDIYQDTYLSNAQEEVIRREVPTYLLRFCLKAHLATSPYAKGQLNGTT